MLEEKVEALTTEVVALRKVMEQVLKAGGTAAPAAAAEEKAPAKKPAAKKPSAKKVEPNHSEDEVAAIMRKAAKDVDKKQITDYIGEQGCADLAELLTKPELFDAAYAFAAEMLGEGEEEESEDDDI